MPKKIAPLTVLDTQIQSKNDKTTLVEVSLVLQIVSGVFVIICNILFIWFGILSGWYDVTPELKVISVGEGIIAGVLYFIFAGSSLFILHCQQRSSHGVFLTLNILVIFLRYLVKNEQEVDILGSVCLMKHALIPIADIES